MITADWTGLKSFSSRISYWTNTRAGKALIPDLVSRGANRVLRSIPVKRSFPAGLIPYGGWQHMILTNYCVEYTLNFIEDNPQYLRFFRFAHVPDEIALQTIIINSPFKKYVVNYSLKYINYDRAPHYILDLSDLSNIKNSYALFARKMNTIVSRELLDHIDRIRE